MWTDLDFPASFSPAHTFYEELLRAKLLPPPFPEVLKTLEEQPTYQIHALYREQKSYRHLENVPGQGIQVDSTFIQSTRQDLGTF